MDKVKIELTLTPGEVKTVMDLLMSMREDRSEDIARSSAELVGNVPQPPAPPIAVPQAPVAVPQAPAAAPVAVPTTSPTPATVSFPVDSRGVMWHPDHHSGTATEPGMNDNGSWKKRRGHNPEALKTYEAQYLGKSAVAQPPQLPLTPPPPPPPPGTPGAQDTEFLWVKLCGNGIITTEHEAYIIHRWGGHPTASSVFRDDAAKRRGLYEFLKQYDVPVAAA